jgi:hypothetical protein
MTTTGIARPSRFVDSTDERDKQIDDGTMKLPGLWALGKHMVWISMDRLSFWHGDRNFWAKREIRIKTAITIRKKITSGIRIKIRTQLSG